MRGDWCVFSLRMFVAIRKAIHEYLSPIDQDSVDRPELLPLAGQLAETGLMRHKDRAVRVLVACGLANVLRLFAPDAPYSLDQLEVTEWVGAVL